jgi:hypothetical protein
MKQEATMPDEKNTQKPQPQAPRPPKKAPGAFIAEGGQGTEGDGDSGNIAFGNKKK